jgi:hypothetical protein
MNIFDADDPLVLNGTYDQEGYTPKERRALARRASAAGGVISNNGLERKTTMRLFDDDNVGCYLDHIGHKIDDIDGHEIKLVDLTLRLQPLTPELALSLDPDVRAYLFSLSDATPKSKLKAVHFRLPIPKQQLLIRMLPELAEQIVFCDCEITDVRARTQKNVDGWALVFHVLYGPASPRELEYVCEWLTQQRFITFQPQQPALDFAAKDEADVPPSPPRRGRGRPRVVEAGDEIRPGVHAEH